jgi:site-specific DNA-methyltransferase (adenine-specific)
MTRARILVGDCRASMATLPDASVDAVVCDPPYELGFMGRKWDSSGIAYDLEVWRQCARVLKPGGHLLAFSGSRTYHRMACAIEDAGFDVRDQIMWLYGSGFPKSLDVSKAIDITAPATDAARQWSGWGTAIKPAHEPICMARKPLVGTVASNVLTHGTGALNIDGCRVAWRSEVDAAAAAAATGFAASRANGTATQSTSMGKESRGGGNTYHPDQLSGRWPANLIHDGSDEATEGLREAARYFYTAKADRADRDEVLGDLPTRTGAQAVGRKEGSAGTKSPRAGAGALAPSIVNHHPTVKPTELMRYLVRMVTPPGGLVLDPFTGSGSTGRAAMLEGMRFVGCELSPEYAEIARARIRYTLGPLFAHLVE